MQTGPALAAALRSTTLDVSRTVGRYDAIVVGAGAAGGLAALSLAEAGLRVLVLEAGAVRSLKNSFFRRLRRGLVRRILSGGTLAGLDRRRQKIQSQCYAWPNAPDSFVDDIDCPYVTPSDCPFIWLRARQLGGRWAVPGHGRQHYRLGPDDLAPQDGQSSPWPLEMSELAFWYASVERRLRLAGGVDHLPWLPDSELATVLEPTLSERALQESIVNRWPGASPILGRFGAWFDFLEAAAQTGRLLIRSGAIVREIEVERSGRVRGVSWIDQKSRTEQHAQAPLVFLCASALESTRLLLLSRSFDSTEGLGGSSGSLGRYLMDHVWIQMLGRGRPLSSGHAQQYERCIYLPRFDSRNLPRPAPNRGFGVQVLQVPDDDDSSRFIADSFAEMLPRPENRVTLDRQRDAWGIPILNIECRHGDSELAQARDQILALRELADVAGVASSQIDARPRLPGMAIHECGTARMGKNHATSVVDSNNECWEARGLYVTDGACFPSQGTQNPTLTILALTARACHHASQLTSAR
jgi:choline dehydrogenase-like flavoprotein